MSNNPQDQQSQPPISPLTPSGPSFTLDSASVNAQPAELDSQPVSSSTAAAAAGRRGSKALALEALHAERGIGEEERERRAKLILQRQSNPAVLVDIPKEPGPEELEEAAAETGEEGAKAKEKKA